MKRFLLSLVIVALHFSYSSAEPLDSLCERIGQCLDDVTRLDEGRQLLEQAFATDGVEHDRFYPQLLYLQSHYYTNTGDFARSKQHLLQLLSLLPADCNAELSISVPQELGLAYRREGKLDSAFHYYDQAIEEAWRQGDLEWQAAISANVGILHYNINHFAEAEQYLQQGLEYVRQVDDPYTELCLLQTCGAVKVALGKLQEAEPLLRQAYQMATKAESPDWQLRCLTTMMPMYDKMGFADSAQACRERGDVLLSQLPQQSITATGFITSRANHYYDNGKWQQASATYHLHYTTETAYSHSRSKI